MNLAHPEGQEGEEGDGGGGEEEEDGMEPPAASEDGAGERGVEVAAAVAAFAADPLKEEQEETAESGGGRPSWEPVLSAELQQGYRILREFLLEKHRPLTAPFLKPLGGQAAEDGQSGAASGGAREPGGGGGGMWLLKMDEKFATGQYRGIADFVADFRLMLETCYRLHGVDHWLSKQAQKLEMMLEQKLALLSRLREQERREAEEASQKEIEEWEKSLLSLAAPTRMENMWEIPSIGHFLCLAQHSLNLPEIVFYELERCLLMPQCSAFLSKIMTSLLCPPHRRSTLHRRPTLSYGTWEAALRQKVQQWYTAVGQTDNPDSCAEKLGLCPQFFKVLGEVNPLEEKPFHELCFDQKVWLLKGLCDFVYETQKDVQDAVLGQPIHECREVILGYDYLEHAYVHFPQFCGADVRIYKQKPFHAPEFPIPSIKVKRVPRTKLEKVKCEYVSKSNGEVRLGTKEEILPRSKTQSAKNTCLAKVHLDHLAINQAKETNSSSEEKVHKECGFRVDCCKENRDKTIVAKEIVAYGGPLSPGEIRIVENGEKCDEASAVKTEATPLKENTLKTCQLHVNGNRSDNPDMNCHKVPKGVTTDSSVENKTLKFNKVRTKKKKKKKKKLKDFLSENLQRKREIHLHSLKSYKPEIQNKLLLMKKKAKHKKHKSGKKSVSKKAVTKKRKSLTKPTAPEFQLICTNLDELRDLIRKIENELKEVENIKKKSGRWFHRKQAVKELHCTLIRLLNELLPWEPKLMKAFQRNRSRLKKDYDDFKRQPDHDKFTREQWTNEDSEINTGVEVSSRLTSESTEHNEFLKRDYTDSDDVKLSEMDLAAGKSRALKKELICKDTQKAVPKSVKRLCKQNCYLDESTKEFSPRKKLKLSTDDTTVHSLENDLSNDGCLNKSKLVEFSSSESLEMAESLQSVSSFKGAKPIQALLAKNMGNKVTLTNQLPPTAGRSILTSEQLLVPSVGSSSVKPVLPCQTSSKNPLQVLYKIPGAHCVPLDLHNNALKIQVQPVGDCKAGEKTTGEKMMQQVLILPKNFLIHHRENASMTKEVQPLPQKTTEQPCISLPQPNAVNTTLAPALPTSVINAATAFLPSPNFKKSTAQPISTANSPATLSSINPTVVKMSQIETTKTKMVVSAASFPVASPTVSSAVPSSTATLPQSVSACASSASSRQASPQSSDAGEAKQELKTICIRDSQSILVRTRGGNTGIVKVQTNSDQISPSHLSPSSVFTYAPPLQAFLVPKSTPLPTSSFSTLTTGTSTFPSLVQPSSISSSIPAIPVGVNQVMGKNVAFAFGQPHGSGAGSPGIPKPVPVSSPAFFSPLSSTSIVIPAPPNNSGNKASPSQGNPEPSTAGTAQPPATNQHADVNSKKWSVTQPEATPVGAGNVMGTAQIPKLMLVTNPPLVPVCGTSGVNVIPAPTSAGITAQKLVFINTPLANIQSNASLAAESFKQAFPPSVGKTFIKSTEPPQLVLIPSTLGAPIKVNASPTVSQIKDVKIGLNIGQAIINSSSNAQNIPSINILQPTALRDTEEKNGQGVTLPFSSGSGLASQNVGSAQESLSIATRAVNTSTVTTTNAGLDLASVTVNGTPADTRPSVLASGTDISAKAKSILTPRPRTSNAGNSIAISTVKTGHLASSVLISTSQPTASHPSLSSAFQLPTPVALPGPMNGAPSIMPTVPPLTGGSPAPQCMPPSKGQLPSPGSSVAVPMNGSAPKPQTVLSPNTPSAGKVISFSNVVPLACQPLPSNFIKPAPAFSCTPGASTTQTVPASSSVTSSAAGQLNDSCIQQKIIINTCTPLAPGTQIMISGTRFIVPPQGLGVGSHVLLISTNPKFGPLLTISNGHGFQNVAHPAPAPQKTMQVLNNTLSWLPSKQPLKSSTKIVNSLGTANPLPIVHATPQIVNSATKASTPAFATMPSTSLATTLVTTLTKPSSVSAAQSSNSQLQSSTSVLHLDTSIKKLMVSPEGAILNAIKTPTSKPSSLPSSFSPGTVSSTGNPTVVFPNFLKSSVGVPDTAAS